MPGTFESGFPWVEIEIIGNERAHKQKVIVDTGFDGYLSLPYESAFPIGLTLDGIGSGKVADGSFSPFLTCIGTVVFNGTRVRTVIDVQKDCRPLMGNELLKELRSRFIFDPINQRVTLEKIT